MKPKRKVRIERKGGAWAVVYVERRKGQRYWAANFYAADHSMTDVIEWVKQNPKLELVP